MGKKIEMEEGTQSKRSESRRNEGDKTTLERVKFDFRSGKAVSEDRYAKPKLTLNQAGVNVSIAKFFMVKDGQL